MKKVSTYSYMPYRPLFTEVGNPYICRVVPSETTIFFEWLPEETEIYEIFCRERGNGEFFKVGETKETSFTIVDLKTETDYEFYVTAGETRSRIRLARPGEVVGMVVNYLHPEDEAYVFSGRYLCSPSLLKHPDGYMLASMDIYGMSMPQTMTLVYRSDDNGKTWQYQCELFPCFWGKLFLHRGAVYMLSVNTEYGDLLISKSIDGGKSFCEPVILIRGGNGKNNEAGVHKNPQPVVEFEGRLWNTMEWGCWGRGFGVMVMSASVEDDLMNPDSWSFSEPLCYDENWEGVPKGKSNGNIEGSLVPIDGELYNMMRYDMSMLTPNHGLMLAYRVNTKNPEAPLEFAKAIPFMANHAKFTIKYDEISKQYYTIANRILDSENSFSRNLQSLFVSENGWDWQLKCDLIDRRNEDREKIGFQYVDFEFDGDDIIYLCRTAMNGAHTFHDSNYQTFHRIENFRD
ncbi:MAG: hypothetical protein E7397_09525 [Ruminococcaceae bacterium]|nr:hypothetical protein [Oscillospiraceae bacterium]